MAKIEKCITGSFEMSYFRFGEGSETLVIIPGLSAKSVMGAADAIIEEYKIMKDDFTVYVIDRRESFPPVYPIHEMAEDTVTVLNKLGLSNICLFGTSQSGMISMDIAINHPGLVKKLVLGSTSAHVTPKQLTLIDEWIDYAQKGDRQNLFLRFGEAVYSRNVFEQYRDYFIETSKTVTDEELKKFIIGAENIKDFNLSDRIKDIQCPTFVIGDYNDDVLDADATMEIAENLDYRPDFKMYMYIGYGHAAYDTAPDYRKRVRDFLVG